MRNPVPKLSEISSVVTSPAPTRRSLAELVAPLNAIAVKSPSLVINRGATFERRGQAYQIPRYLFIGPSGGDAPIRIGIFAGIHGDEPEGAFALVHFVQALEARPDLATGYCLSIYPVCNPTGFEDNTRHARGGRDLNREFWKNSREPEVRLLQAELVSRSFHGIISLHTDDTADGFYGIARGATLTSQLIEPALRAAETFLPRDNRTVIDGFHARDGVIHDCYEGVLSAPPRIRPKPFEIILETPKSPPEYLKEYSFVLALRSILAEYTKFIAYARNL